MKSFFKIIIIILVVLPGSVFIFNFLSDGEFPEFPEIVSGRHPVDNADDELKSPRSSVEMINGRLAVHLPDAIQQQANLELTRISRAEYKNEIHAIAQVIDIQPLVRLRSDIRQVRTEIRMAETALQVSGQEFERLKLLHKEASNISERELQQARLKWMSDGLELEGKRNRFDDLKDASIQSWGNELTEQILSNSDIVNQLFERKLLLLLVTLEINRLLPENTDTVVISQREDPDFSGAAYFLARALQVDNRIPGQTYLFYTPAISLRTGQYVDVWVPAGSDMLDGVYIPPAAIIWYVDKPWVYLKIDDHSFIRKELADFIITRQGWFVRNGFQDGDEIVLHGAQMLLSEEFRWSIPDEDDNP